MVAVMLMVFITDVLLLFASERLSGAGTCLFRIMLGAAMDALLALLSFQPVFSRLHPVLCRLACLSLAAMVAFGIHRCTFPKLALFLLFQLSLGGITGQVAKTPAVLLAAAGIGFAGLLVSRQRQYIPVELHYQNQTMRITALRDTGNHLRDPITGKSVLVVGADVAQKLTGLTADALRDPVKTMGTIPGLRLIPYQSVGSSGFLLAVYVPQARIGTRQGSAIVAFSPKLFESHYQALTGGEL